MEPYYFKNMVKYNVYHCFMNEPGMEWISLQDTPLFTTHQECGQKALWFKKNLLKGMNGQMNVFNNFVI